MTILPFPEPTPDLKKLARAYKRFAERSPDYKKLWEIGNKHSALQGQAIGSAHATLCYLRDWVRDLGIGSLKIGDTTLDLYLDKAIKELL